MSNGRKTTDITGDRMKKILVVC
ncbi:protein-tyrosine-phosphatase, partial [Vibrio vulnificus]